LLLDDIKLWTSSQLKNMTTDRVYWRRRTREWSSADTNPERGRLINECMNE